MNEKFEYICKMTQKEVKKYANNELRKTHEKVYCGDGFVFAKGTFPVLLVAHMDTVHSELPWTILYDMKKDRLSSPNGIGGDDRCGIYMVLEIIKRYNCSVLFCEDEERGGIGADKFIETDLAQELKFNYAIEFDRKGNNDAVFYECDNEEFEDFITSSFYKTAYGTFSDISILAPFLGCAAVNLSCGYYNAHTKEEYVVLSEMETSIKKACEILSKTTASDEFEYVEAVDTKDYDFSHYGYFTKQGNSFYDNKYEYEESYYIIEYTDENGKDNWFDTFAVSEAEAVGRFLMWNPDLCYGDVIDIMVDNNF